eukprot:CAMPEP_0178433788 /NCGR_PEP_ID=MMETSP0689_2-20121128/33089_1 /TAXON_ID=160604 /ORGANISM="Amphidinium massartii, Strain CS-259" /LENGTH=85 /DNA_ID=CAMNT_0020055833 /DNA_START=765 /DNA_END=1022 /DNA_ORIENTATION=-
MAATNEDNAGSELSRVGGSHDPWLFPIGFALHLEIPTPLMARAYDRAIPHVLPLLFWKGLRLQQDAFLRVISINHILQLLEVSAI